MDIFVNGISLGQPIDTGVITSLDDNASAFALGVIVPSSGVGDSDMWIDEVRMWGDLRTDAEMLANYCKTVTSGADLSDEYCFTKDIKSAVEFNKELDNNTFNDLNRGIIDWNEARKQVLFKNPKRAFEDVMVDG